jgi:hypothetical protein
VARTIERKIGRCLPQTFFADKISNASSSYPGAIIPSLTQVLINIAVDLSTLSLNAAKSPNDDFGSAFLARMYALNENQSKTKFGLLHVGIVATLFSHSTAHLTLPILRYGSVRACA